MVEKIVDELNLQLKKSLSSSKTITSTSKENESRTANNVNTSSADERYVMKIEKMCRLYEELTGILIESVEEPKNSDEERRVTWNCVQKGPSGCK